MSHFEQSSSFCALPPSSFSTTGYGRARVTLTAWCLWATCFLLSSPPPYSIALNSLIYSNPSPNWSRLLSLCLTEIQSNFYAAGDVKWMENLPIRWETTKYWGVIESSPWVKSFLFRSTLPSNQFKPSGVSIFRSLGLQSSLMQIRLKCI